MIFRAYWKSKTAPEGATPYCGFVMADHRGEARRIMEENLDTMCYEVTEVTEAAMHMVTPQSITINFQNTSQYHFGW